MQHFSSKEKEFFMFVSIIDLQIGQGDADTLLSRIENDLIPIYEDAEDFIG
jgi:hypothetical protein